MTRSDIDRQPPQDAPDVRRDTRGEAPMREQPDQAPTQEVPTRTSPGREAPTKTRRGSTLGSLLAVLLIGAGVYAAYHYLVPHGEKTGSSAGHGTPPQTVGAATIGRGDVVIDVEALGTVTPIANIIVKTQINGQLVSVGFKEGQMVKAGDFLAQIDARPYQALEQQYEGQLARDQGLLDEANADAKRYQTLLNQTSIARQTAEDQKYVVQQDLGTVASDKGLIQTQKVNIAFCHITAPVSGRVGLRQVDPGNYVQTTDTNGIVVLTQLQPISVIFSVPENLIPEIVDAQKAKAQLQATAFDQANLHQLSTGQLETLDNTIDTTTGMVKARATFANPDDHLYPNQFVNIHLQTGELHNVVVAPSAAIQRGTDGTFVYLVGADSTVSVRKITVGPTQGTTVAVTDGLQPGDRVVVDGSDRLRAGSRVVVAGASAHGGKAAVGSSATGAAFSGATPNGASGSTAPAGSAAPGAPPTDDAAQPTASHGGRRHHHDQN